MSNNYFNFTIPRFNSDNGSDWDEFNDLMEDWVDHFISKIMELYWLRDPSKLPIIALEKALRAKGIRFDASDSVAIKRFKLRNFNPSFESKGMAQVYLDIAESVTGEVGTLEISGGSNFIVNFNTQADFTTQVPLDEEIGTFAALNSTDVAALVPTLTPTMELRTYRFSEGSWSQIGNSFTIPGGATNRDQNHMCALSSVRIAYVDVVLNQLITFDFDGTDWSQTGSAFTFSPAIGTPFIAALDSTDVAFIDYTQDDLTTYRFNGSTWSKIGTELNVAINTCALTALNSTDVAHVRLVGGVNPTELRTYRFNGSTWSLIGNVFTMISTYKDICALNSTDVAVVNPADHIIRTLHFDGSDWSQIGESFEFISTASFPTVTALSPTRIATAYNVIGNREAWVYDLDDGEWALAVDSDELDEIKRLLMEKHIRPAFYRINLIDDDDNILRIIQ